MTELQLRERHSPFLRCAYCHGAVSSEQVRCPDCDGRYHAGCWEAGCANLGCLGGKTPIEIQVRLRRHPWRAFFRWLAPACLLGAGLLGSADAFFSARTNESRLVFGCLFLASLWLLLTWWSESRPGRDARGQS